jgi:hypothetical protein
VTRQRSERKELDLTRPSISALKLTESDKDLASDKFLGLFFGDATARLFKLPTAAPIVKLCTEVLDAYESIDDYEDDQRDTIMGSIPMWAVEDFDTALIACKALRAISVPRPFPNGAKAASDTFAPKDPMQLHPKLRALVDTVRSSNVWSKLVDDFWGQSMQDEKYASELLELEGQLTDSLDNSQLEDAEKIMDKLSIIQVSRRQAFIQSQI